jgi:hypothetical protein
MGKDLSLIGILIALGAAFALWHGSIFGENTIGISVLMGIFGIILVALAHKSEAG